MSDIFKHVYEMMDKAAQASTIFSQIDQETNDRIAKALFQAGRHTQPSVVNQS